MSENETPISEQILLTYDEVGSLLRCHRRTVERLVKAGHLPVVHVLSKAFIRRGAVDGFITANERTAS